VPPPRPPRRWRRCSNGAIWPPRDVGRRRCKAAMDEKRGSGHPQRSRAGLSLPRQAQPSACTSCLNRCIMSPVARDGRARIATEACTITTTSVKVEPSSAFRNRFIAFRLVQITLRFH
jgi:hypothetical protein